MCTCPHALQPFFPLLSITFIIIPTLQLLLKYCWRAMKKPRTHGMSNPSQGTKWPKAERCVPGNRGQASVRDTCPMVWVSCPSSEYCQTLGLSSFFWLLRSPYQLPCYEEAESQVIIFSVCWECKSANADSITGCADLPEAQWFFSSSLSTKLLKAQEKTTQPKEELILSLGTISDLTPQNKDFFL